MLSFPPRRHLANPSCIMQYVVQYCCRLAPPSPTTNTTATLPTYPLSPVSRMEDSPKGFIQYWHTWKASLIGSNWFPHSGTSASVAQYPPNPNVVWRRALSICCHCARQNLRRDRRVLNVSGVANVRIAVAIALRNYCTTWRRAGQAAGQSGAEQQFARLKQRTQLSPDLVHFTSVMNEICSPSVSTLLDRYYNL